MDHDTCPVFLLPAVEVVVVISKPGETADVPIGVIVGSIFAGLLLLALAVGLLWKVSVSLHFCENITT